MHQISAAQLNLQRQVLQYIHLTEIAICDSLWYWQCTSFATSDHLQSIQILIHIYPVRSTADQKKAVLNVS